MPIQIEGVPKGYYPIPKIPKNKYYMQGNCIWNGSVWIPRLAAYGLACMLLTRRCEWLAVPSPPPPSSSLSETGSKDWQARLARVT